MKITVKIVPEKSTREVDIKKGTSVSDLLRKIHLRPDMFIVLKNNTPIPIDDVLNDEQELCLLQVASGG
jgi:sulfur carrier protein ThiS